MGHFKGFFEGAKTFLALNCPVSIRVLVQVHVHSISLSLSVSVSVSVPASVSMSMSLPEECPFSMFMYNCTWKCTVHTFPTPQLFLCWCWCLCWCPYVHVHVWSFKIEDAIVNQPYSPLWLSDIVIWENIDSPVLYEKSADVLLNIFDCTSLLKTICGVVTLPTKRYGEYRLSATNDNGASTKKSLKSTLTPWKILGWSNDHGKADFKNLFRFNL